MGHTIQETTVTVFIGNYIHRVNVIKGSLYSQVYGTISHMNASISCYFVARLTRLHELMLASLVIGQKGET